MSLLDRIRDCNNHDPSGFLPFRVDGQAVGWVLHDFGAQLAPFDDVFIRSDGALSLRPELTGFAARSAAFARVIRELADKGLIPGWRGELYPVVAAEGGEPLFAMERAAAIRFGVRSFGVHLMGYSGQSASQRLWVAKRSATKATGPGMKDAFVGGGIAYGTSVWDTMIKEAWEEAGVPPVLAAQAEPAGEVRFVYQNDLGVDQGLDYQYELALPEDFNPDNQDGEVAGFSLRPAVEIMADLAESQDYFYDASLAYIAFFLRHGHIGPDHPDHGALLQGLQGQI